MAMDVATVHTLMTRAMALGHRLDVINPGHAYAALCRIDRGPLNLVEAREGSFRMTADRSGRRRWQMIVSPESTFEHLADVRSVSTIRTDILPPIPLVSFPTSSSLNSNVLPHSSYIQLYAFGNISGRCCFPIPPTYP